ncbi:hypothetical protein [Paludibacterium yongneupense]|uniref:hypothetical protein n=1 Tax=Paludibacterium yongneupense TaxID=400061 RepID=UPI0003F81217|nr:hypothetical protein [Paludibacterium yongneupense]
MKKKNLACSLVPFQPLDTNDNTPKNIELHSRANQKIDYRYINPKAVEKFLGRYAPFNTKLFATVLEEAMKNLNEGYTYTSSKVRCISDPPEISKKLIGISDKLLANNLNRKGMQPWELYNGLDFDIVHTATLSEGVTTDVKAYFYHTEFARPKEERRVVLHIIHNTFSETQWAIHLPIQILMKGWPSITDDHVGYAHSIALSDSAGKFLDEHVYIGVSKRNWLQRMAEHFTEIRSGSNKTFHRAWRQYAGNNNVILSSELVVCNHTYEQIMAWEEEIVDKYMAIGKSLNMIPGGFKGIKFLHKLNLLRPSGKVALEERERAIEAYQYDNPRAGIPNLLISNLWQNEDYAVKVICSAENRLSVDQVRLIRRLSEDGTPIDRIVSIVGALNTRQVERVLRGETYSRIH